MVLHISREGGELFVSRAGSHDAMGRYPAVHIHGCDTAVPARGKLEVYGYESTWVSNGELHISDDKRGGPGRGRTGVSL